jgi:HTH-type transcriptional regulator / antitoxin HigA
MRLRILKTKEDHAEALSELDRLMDTNPRVGTNAADTLELLADLIDRYERKQFPSKPLSPINIVKYVMEENGLKQKDMIPYLGSAPKVSEILSGTRPLSKAMIQRLHHDLGIPASLLLGPPTAKQGKTTRPTPKSSLRQSA